ncbi:GTP-binding protein [Campylobacter sp. MIT 21-1685]|uniref:CobW family GTP-binding protein n=1 Tax=unclassified Campylobacter TaxID=2593542 RepID=UPI00224AC57F|nr:MULTISPECIES: GTP-binding protein [unclassified Campylobacter]MCX2682548.1 GTP-binding protein [Campylobacter sp. MIT 21-1684]MCX2750739.1 GTP-binding protein [Campylobacter sp. MIT 21-1682]MCX2807029.1 GTP-binding protein [Campylobacter sp. MIT 21-1685]
MSKISVHIITGFLGSGKTTFLKELLRERKNTNTAILVNELGEISLDDVIIETEFVKEKTIILPSGCICCNKREDLIKKFKEMLNKYDQNRQIVERIIIETTGLANPAPIIFTFLSDSFLSNHFQIVNIITCVDALNGLSHIQNNEEACAQIINSDCIVLTKNDLNQKTDSLIDTIQSLHYGVNIIAKENFYFNTLNTLQHKIFHFSQKEVQNKIHKNTMHSICLRFDGTFNWSVFSIWLSMLLHRYGSQILRIKGLIYIGEGHFININAVGHLVYPPEHINKLEKEKRSQLVFIAKNLDLTPITTSLQSFLNLCSSKVKLYSSKKRF